MRGSEVTSITYDGPLVTSVKRSGSVTDTLSFTYRSGDFRPTSFTYSGATQSFGYDADGLVVSAAPFTIARDAASGLATRVVAPGFALSRTYSAYGEIDAVDYGAYRYALTRDVSGRIVAKTETTADGTTEWGYGYDTLGRLTSVTKDGEPFESYELDSHGNRTGMTAPWRGIEATVHASFDAEDRTTRIGEVVYTYTADGFIASKTEPAGTTRYTYTGLGELSSVLRPDGQRIDYTYDANGLRVAKAIDGRIVERYSWADNTRLLATYDGAGALTRRFLYADARTPYAMDTPAGRRYLAYDQVGSVRALTDESGRVVGTLVHDSFGMVVEQSGEATSAGLGFAAGLSDPDTGLVLFGARDYDPASGRWMAKDPIGFAGGDVNLYGYCLGDPVNLVDPSGLWALGYSQGFDAGVWNLGKAAGSRGVLFFIDEDGAFNDTTDVATYDSWYLPLCDSSQSDGFTLLGNAGVTPVSVSFTNADEPSQLNGEAEVHTVDAWIVEGSFYRAGSIWGGSLGFSLSALPLSYSKATMETKVSL